MADRFAVVGGGIIGLSVAYQLLRRVPGASVTVYEKEPEVGAHQSGHNSGVLHAGLYYRPGSRKAALAVSGIRQMIAFCHQHGIPHETCGKLVVAVSDDEVPRLRELHHRGQQNGLKGLRWLSPPEMCEIEPQAAGVAAVHVPEEGIVDYPEVCRTLRRLIESSGGTVRTGSGVTALTATRPGWVVHTATAEQPASFVFNCAGLHCDRILAMAGEPRTTRIVPFRGEYYMLSPAGQKLVRNLIYPVPDPQFPFLGVHFTRMIHGGVEAGPNAVLALAREGYRWSDISASDAFDALAYPGLWRFLQRYPAMCAYEVRRSLSKSEFCRSLQRLVPAVQPEHLQRGGAGVRAQALAPDGSFVQDFDYVVRPDALHLINAPSPGATAALAIAESLLDAAGIKAGTARLAEPDLHLRH